MNNYIPTKLKDLTESKQRVMRNVLNELENNSIRPKRKWRYAVITAILTMSAMLFVLNELFIENEQQSVTELQLDMTKPTFSEEQGLLYLHGVTLGDKQSSVIERLGENYTVVDFEDGTVADLILDYNGHAKFYFYKDRLDRILFYKVDENYFDKLFIDYVGVKFTSYDNRYIYSKETSHILKSEYDPDGNLYLSLSYAGPDLLENAGFLELENLKQPTFSEEQGLLYLHGITLGDKQSSVIERLGENYTVVDFEDGTLADLILDYNGHAKFYFYEDKLDSIVFMNVDESYFDKLFNDYDGFKFLTPTTDNDRYIYSKETGQLLKATIVPDGNLYLYLLHGGKDLLENPDFPKIDQILD